MNLKTKKRIMLSILALSLGTTGWGTNYQENALNEINETLEEDFYKESRTTEINAEYYGGFYRTYLNTFGDYMSKKQYKQFEDLTTSYDILEECDDEAIANMLDAILFADSSRGKGIYSAFNRELLYEEFQQHTVFYNKTYKQINRLKFLINDDDAFYKAMFSGNIEDFIKLLAKSTGCEEIDASTLVAFFDDYYIGLKTGYFNRPQEEIEKNIDFTIEQITNTKLKEDKVFAKTFYARMFINNKRYFEQVTLTPSLISKQAHILIEDNEDISFDFDSKYLNETELELWQLKAIKANDYIKEAYDSYYNDKYDLEGMPLLAILLSSNCTLEDTINEDEIRCEIYADLKNYFNSLDDFNNFVLKLFNRDEDALNRYFEIFKERLQEDDIDITDFMRYEALRKLVKKHEINTIHFDNVDYGSMRDIIPSMPKEEALKYVSFVKENYRFYNVDYDKYFTEIDSILKNNDLGISRIINDEIDIKWGKKPISITGYYNNSTVVSTTVSLKEMNVDGIDMLYFEAPENFEDGYLAEVYYNIEGDPVIKEFNGLSTYLEKTKNEGNTYIIVVSLNNEEEIPENLVFVKNYPVINHLDKNESNEKGPSKMIK